MQFEDNAVAEIEILDTFSGSNNAINLDYMRWADCFLLVYSVIDRASFYEVEKILQQLSKVKVPSYYSTLILGNKCDMENHRWGIAYISTNKIIDSSNSVVYFQQCRENGWSSEALSIVQRSVHGSIGSRRLLKHQCSLSTATERVAIVDDTEKFANTEEDWR